MAKRVTLDTNVVTLHVSSIPASDIPGDTLRELTHAVYPLRAGTLFRVLSAGFCNWRDRAEVVVSVVEGRS